MKMWRKIFTTAALTFMLCLTGLAMSGEAQAERFVDNGNGTVTDTVTNLMWTKDANPFGRLNWDDAMSRCSSFSISGIGGWRLPSRDELVALHHAIQGGHPFTGVQSSWYWSSTTYPRYTDGVWRVSMYSGWDNATGKADTAHVWPVRAGQ
ncbi:Protein of unknown function [Desulfonatronum zhilinae]|nr:Protein of unknown function [Desulfonatronum zhilinae]